MVEGVQTRRCVDLIIEGLSIRPLSWHIAKALMNQTHERMVIANFLKIFCPVLNF